MTLLLGPPSSGKTTLLLAMAGKLDPALRVKIIFPLHSSLNCQFLALLSSLISSLIQKTKTSPTVFREGDLQWPRYE
jgi:energy-coupling factor transporter ATP-binding protein EcfA2